MSHPRDKRLRESRLDEIEGIIRRDRSFRWNAADMEDVIVELRLTKLDLRNADAALDARRKAMERVRVALGADPCDALDVVADEARADAARWRARAERMASILRVACETCDAERSFDPRYRTWPWVTEARAFLASGEDAPTATPDSKLAVAARLMAGLISTMPQYSHVHPGRVLEEFMARAENEARETPPAGASTVRPCGHPMSSTRFYWDTDKSQVEYCAECSGEPVAPETPPA